MNAVTFMFFPRNNYMTTGELSHFHLKVSGILIFTDSASFHFVHTSIEKVSFPAKGNAVSPPSCGLFK